MSYVTPFPTLILMCHVTSLSGLILMCYVTPYPDLIFISYDVMSKWLSPFCTLIFYFFCCSDSCLTSSSCSCLSFCLRWSKSLLRRLRAWLFCCWSLLLSVSISLSSDSRSLCSCKQTIKMCISHGPQITQFQPILLGYNVISFISNCHNVNETITFTPTC